MGGAGIRDITTKSNRMSIAIFVYSEVIRIGGERAEKKEIRIWKLEVPRVPVPKFPHVLGPDIPPGRSVSRVPTGTKTALSTSTQVPR
jgi:hypothetical protein